jgi:squalene-hopene/tetraprenyl-beta-curcumene cyclase
VRALLVFAVAVFLLSISAVGAERWSPSRASQYLDERLKQWFEWKPAMSDEGPCVSCHTGMTYLLARPALRQRLGEAQPTAFERGLLDRLRSNLGHKPEGYLQRVDAVFAALFLSPRRRGEPMGDEARRAFDQLWELQARDGPAKGTWEWLTVDLDPWEHSESGYFGAAMVALALRNADAAYVRQPAVANRIADLTTFLRTSSPRPLHDRIARLWASPTSSPLLSSSGRRALVDEILRAQQPDGGWTSASLGPWTSHPQAPPDAGSNAFATGYVAYVLHHSGHVPRTDRRLARALSWLASHQDASTGAWPAVSLNKVYPAGSMQSLFMQDAATAFASLALLEAGW